MTKILLWGGKSKARIAEAMLQDEGQNVSYIFDPFIDKPDFDTKAKFGKAAEDLKSFLRDTTHFLVCIGGEHGFARAKTSEFLETRFNLQPLGLASKAAHIDTNNIGKGCQFMPGAVVNKFCEIGSYSVINTNATVDHECILGRGVHIMGGASLAGRITIGDYASIGTNATILPNLTIGEGALIGAGAVVTKSVPAYKVVTGIPAKIIKDKKPFVDLSLLESAL